MKEMKVKKYPKEMSKDLAEIIGIMMGDGSFFQDKKKKYHSTVCFNKKETDYLYYTKNLFENYFWNYSFGIVELKNEFFIRNVSVRVGKHLLDSGLCLGNKMKNKITVPSWIFSRKKFLKRLIRGFFDTDGSVYKKYGRYAQIEIKLGCFETLHSVRKVFLKLNFHPTRIQRTKGGFGTVSYRIYLSRQGEIERFFNEISPKNVKHVQRFHKIKNGATGI